MPTQLQSLAKRAAPPFRTPMAGRRIFVAGQTGLRRIACLWSIACLFLSPFASATGGTDGGLPFNRSFSLDEIGVSRGATLAFDPIGRLAVIDSNKYVVLNDSTWINLLQDSDKIRNLQSVEADESGNLYFGALASWGALTPLPNGKLAPRPLRPENAPAWVNSTNFTFIVPVSDGAYFAGSDGVVYWNRQTHEQIFIEVPALARLFKLGAKVYVSSHVGGVSAIDLPNRSLVPVQRDADGYFVVDRIAPTSDGKAVISTSGRRLALFDGEKFQDWPNALGTFQPAQISNILSLPGGGLAISIDGRGLYILSESGECRLALATPDYQRIKHLASREPGILWVVTENELQKLLYSDPVSIVDLRSGLPVSWPHVVEWRGEPLIASHGALFELAPGADGLSRRYRQFPSQPRLGVMGVAILGDQILTGNGEGVHVRKGSEFVPVLTGLEVNRLVPVGEDLCFAVGRTKIAALRWDGKAWSEAAPRIDGIGFPFLSLATRSSAWIELGVNRLARLTLEEGEIKTQVFEDFPWKGVSWVHAGRVGDLVVIGGPERACLFFDETSQQFVDAPELAKLFQTSPMPISRLLEDGSGTLWAAYEHGVYAIRRVGSGYEYDLESFNTVRENFPFIQLSSPSELWVSTGTTLYHIDSDYTPRIDSGLRPMLVSINDTATSELLYSVFNTDAIPDELPYSQNNLQFLFFGGGYSSARSPTYEFRMSSHSNEWTVRSSESSITLANLEEGDYQLYGQLFDALRPVGESVVTSFSIRPPWFRSLPAYSLYTILATAAFLGSIALVTSRGKRRQTFLEALVQERTNELRATMEKLSEKERNAAILAERNRLASEIHDSVQQGLSGLALQLDATLKLPELANAVRSRLAVARRMVTFTRHEVQQAVWDLESPFLENDNLGEALEKMAEFISSGITSVEVQVPADTQRLDSLTQHNLLRIAQEAITNAVRHGKADRITVQLQSDEQSINLAISDNGCGFDPQEMLNNGVGHFGIRGMKARAAKISSSLQIHSENGIGTEIHVSVPLIQKNNGAPLLHKR